MKPSSAEMEDAYRLINAVEAHIQRSSRTPINEEAWKIIDNLGLRSDESCRPCYDRLDNENYLISIGLTVGESYNYSSSTKEWH
jgi:hypothetical protein